jgi:hypothetical protein
MRTLRQQHRPALALLTLTAAVSALAVLPLPAAGAAPPPVPTWAPAATAPIHPGVMTITAGGQCTANFVFYDAADVYIGQAAHCSTTGGPTDLDGCLTGSLPLGTPVAVDGASKPGTLVYNAWLAMQAAHEANPDACAKNDLALVKLDPADAGKVNPSVPYWGGPTGINTAGTALLQKTYSYGNSSLRLGIALLSPHLGIARGDTNNGWSHQVNTIPPDLPGDSGSAYLDATGKALGQLSTLGVGVPELVVNGVGDLRRELDYLGTHSSLSVQMALGTVPFNGKKLPLGL